MATKAPPNQNPSFWFCTLSLYVSSILIYTFFSDFNDKIVSSETTILIGSPTTISLKKSRSKDDIATGCIIYSLILESGSFIDMYMYVDDDMDSERVKIAKYTIKKS